MYQLPNFKIFGRVLSHPSTKKCESCALRLARFHLDHCKVSSQWSEKDCRRIVILSWVITIPRESVLPVGMNAQVKTKCFVPGRTRWRGRQGQPSGTACHWSRVRWAVEGSPSWICRVADRSSTVCCPRSQTDIATPSEPSRLRSRKRDMSACRAIAVADRPLLRLLLRCSPFPHARRHQFHLTVANSASKQNWSSATGSTDDNLMCLVLSSR